MAEDGIGEVAEALTGLVGDVGRFQRRIEERMEQQEERIRMNTKHARPPLDSAAAAAGAPHAEAMGSYLRSGDDDGLRSLSLEGKAMNTAVSADGGYLVDPQTAETVSTVLRSAASIRSVASVVNVEATSYDVLVDHADIGAGWATETAAAGETASPQFDRISIPLHELAAMPKASQRLLDDAAFDVETWLARRIADKFARAEAQAFVAGDGSDKPRGFLTYTAVDDASWTWGNLGTVPSGAAADFSETDPAAALVDLVYALGARYRANATFVMNSKTAGAVRKMKDADGRFLWSDSLAAGQPAQLMGYPVLISEDMPDIAAGALAIAFGDFRAGYTIAERPDLRVLRDPFSAKPHVLFYATKRVGGDVTDFAAIKLLRIAAS
ncbi:phage major capsid protein [Jannaschia sp. W003]|uniref:phage major capsid protein n=1 Tax=Jannaschia sp. W003 TaxID=2867012 RepID=UPI0021A973D5|nr:phage major capsid protein [Jannaschia sp. W003]UWQ21008.1 phage major capsid protein [Jannaschia sp. W003]